MTEILQVQNLVKRYGALAATNDLSMTLRTGELHGVIGPNGAGKTTFIHQLAGEIIPDQGQIFLDGVDITLSPPNERALNGIGRSYQITSVFKDFSVLENVMLAVQAREGSSFRFWSVARDDKKLYEPAHEALRQVQLSHAANRRAGALGYGEMRQLEIAMTLAMHPRVLLLDEPMAGMSQQESARLVDLLSRLKGEYSIVLVEHDMDAVFALADRITVLLYGTAIVCDTPQAIQANQEVKSAYLGDDDDEF
jgi:branched-chain amino acid transport system ATP-binding protein